MIGLALTGRMDQASSQSDTGWVTLFDGSNSDNWTTIGKVNWRVEINFFRRIRASRRTPIAIFRWDSWVDGDANSGIFLRCADPQKPGNQGDLREAAVLNLPGCILGEALA